jgi:hypothetical protein
MDDSISMRTTVDQIDHECEQLRRRKILDCILGKSEGNTFEFEERDLTRPCVGTTMNGFKHEEPTGDKEFIIRVKNPNRR